MLLSQKLMYPYPLVWTGVLQIHHSSVVKLLCYCWRLILQNWICNFLTILLAVYFVLCFWKIKWQTVITINFILIHFHLRLPHCPLLLQYLSLVGPKMGHNALQCIWGKMMTWPTTTNQKLTPILLCYGMQNKMGFGRCNTKTR